jgi:hypothetical protein
MLIQFLVGGASGLAQRAAHDPSFALPLRVVHPLFGLLRADPPRPQLPPQQHALRWHQLGLEGHGMWNREMQHAGPKNLRTVYRKYRTNTAAAAS